MDNWNEFGVSRWTFLSQYYKNVIDSKNMSYEPIHQVIRIATLEKRFAPLGENEQVVFPSENNEFANQHICIYRNGRFFEVWVERLYVIAQLLARHAVTTKLKYVQNSIQAINEPRQPSSTSRSWKRT